MAIELGRDEVLKLGDSGPRVEALKLMLLDMGHKELQTVPGAAGFAASPVDDRMDQATVDALKSEQAKIQGFPATELGTLTRHGARQLDIVAEQSKKLAEFDGRAAHVISEIVANEDTVRQAPGKLTLPEKRFQELFATRDKYRNESKAEQDALNALNAAQAAEKAITDNASSTKEQKDAAAKATQEANAKYQGINPKDSENIGNLPEQKTAQLYPGVQGHGKEFAQSVDQMKDGLVFLGYMTREEADKHKGFDRDVTLKAVEKFQRDNKDRIPESKTAGDFTSFGPGGVAAMNQLVQERVHELQQGRDNLLGQSKALEQERAHAMAQFNTRQQETYGLRQTDADAREAERIACEKETNAQERAKFDNRMLYERITGSAESYVQIGHVGKDGKRVKGIKEGQAGYEDAVQARRDELLSNYNLHAQKDGKVRIEDPRTYTGNERDPKLTETVDRMNEADVPVPEEKPRRRDAVTFFREETQHLRDRFRRRHKDEHAPETPHAEGDWKVIHSETHPVTKEELDAQKLKDAARDHVGQAEGFIIGDTINRLVTRSEVDAPKGPSSMLENLPFGNPKGPQEPPIPMIRPEDRKVETEAPAQTPQNNLPGPLQKKRIEI